MRLEKEVGRVWMRRGKREGYGVDWMKEGRREWRREENERRSWRR